jgi:hypothetical protein
MDRKIFTVEPTQTGWRIVSDGREMSRWHVPGPAVERASRIAAGVHRRSNRPTAVEVRYRSGDRAMVEFHG